MTSVGTSAIVFACIFGGALLGILLRSLVPHSHLNSDTKNVVGLGMRLVGTLAAPVWGLLLVASAKSFYGTQAVELTETSAKIVLLDRILSHYGPDGQKPATRCVLLLLACLIAFGIKTARQVF